MSTQTYHPKPGTCLVRRIATQNRHGSLYLPEQAVDRWTAQQVDIVAVGTPAWLDPDDDDVPPGWYRKDGTLADGVEQDHRGRLRRWPSPRLAPGAWAIVKAHMLFALADDLYVVATDAILAVLEAPATTTNTE